MPTAAGRQPAPHSRFFSATLAESDPELAGMVEQYAPRAREGREAFNAKRPPDFTGALRRRGDAWEEPSDEDAKRLDEAYRTGEF